MDRREFIKSAAAIAALPVLPYAASAALAEEKLPIIWGVGTLNNPHVEVVKDWVRKTVKEGFLYSSDIFMGSKIKLTDPWFGVFSGTPVWNWMTGDTAEEGLKIHIHELGVFLAETRIATSVGYEKYWGSGTPRDKKELPDYFVRRTSIDHDRQDRLSALLPKDHVGIDDRSLKHLSRLAKEKSNV